jgi:hypothetical protein
MTLRPGLRRIAPTWNVAVLRKGALCASAHDVTRRLLLASFFPRRRFKSDLSAPPPSSTPASSSEAASGADLKSDNSTSLKSFRGVRNTALFAHLTPPNLLHSSLPTFLEHARRVSLKPWTQVFLGTRYEYLTQTTLARYGFELMRTGKAGDRGVDLTGFWHLPDGGQTEGAPNTRRLRVLTQCKRHRGKKSLQPSAVREMEGAFLGAPSGWRGEDVLGVIVSTKPATKGVLTALSASKRGLVWICLEENETFETQPVGSGVQDEGEKVPAETEDAAQSENVSDEAPSGKPTVIRSVTGRVVQMLYNHAAQRIGLEGLDVIQQHYVDHSDLTAYVEIKLIYRGHSVQDVSEDEQ